MTPISSMSASLFSTMLAHPTAPLLRLLCLAIALGLLWLGSELSTASDRVC